MGSLITLLILLACALWFGYRWGQESKRANTCEHRWETW